MSSSGSKAGIDWILLCHWSCSGIVKNEKNALFDSSPHINHTLPQVIHIPHLPKIWHGASFSYCACHLLRHYRPRSRLAAYDNHYRQRLVCVCAVWPAGLLGSVSAPPHTHFLQYLRSVFRLRRSLLSNVPSFSLSSFTQKISR